MKRNLIYLSAFIVAGGGIVYELIIATVGSYLLGNSVLQFSLTIGLFLTGMGVGAAITPLLKNHIKQSFIISELILALIGGNSVLLLFYFFTLEFNFYILYIALTLIIGGVIGVNLPIIFSLLQTQKSPVVLLSKLLSIDYIGSLLASLIFPLLLLPYLGLLRSAYLIGLLDVATAATIFYIFREDFKSRLLLIGLISTAIVTFLGFISSNYLAQKLDHKLYQDEIIYSKESPYQKIVLTKFQDDLRLFLDGAIQFSSIDEYRYHEALIHIPFNLVLNKENILILGGGDGLAAREILKYPVKEITLVDLDQEVVTLSKDHPLISKLNQNSLHHPKIKIFNLDAAKFLEDSSEIFDIIIIDLPDPNNEALAKLYSKEFYRLISRHLNESGVFVTQATSPYFSPSTFWMIKRTIESEDLYTLPYHLNIPSFGEWGFILGSKHKITSDNLKINVTTDYLNTETTHSLFIFDKDMQEEEDNSINTYLNPIILQSYESDTRRWQ